MKKRPAPPSAPAAPPRSTPSPATPRLGAIDLGIDRGVRLGTLSRAEIRRRIGAMVHALQLHNSEISFLLTDDKRIHQLNKIYRDKDRPTDVLAFAMREGEFAELAGAALGDVIVSVETAEKQARERGVDPLEEVTMLLAHGLLHLLGWDHDTAAKDRRMRAETERLCHAAASSPPAARPDRSAAGRRSDRRGRHPADARREPTEGRSGPEPSPETGARGRSKAAADRSLSRIPPAEKARGKRRKLEPRHEVNPRRSPKR